MEKTLFAIKECSGILDEDQLKTLLRKLPIEFQTVNADFPDRHVPLNKEEYREIEVYHYAQVVSLNPAQGRRLWNAYVTNSDFPLRPDNIMDDNIGLRCCYHPKLASFGLPIIKDINEIEIDIFKYPNSNRCGN
jgi:calcineurin-like phosphoesterase